MRVMRECFWEVSSIVVEPHVNAYSHIECAAGTQIQDSFFTPELTLSRAFALPFAYLLTSTPTRIVDHLAYLHPFTVYNLVTFSSGTG